MRYFVVLLVTASIAISYFDRQTVSVAIAAIQRTIPISNEQFSYLQAGFLLAYAAMYAIGGHILDRLGTRRGFFLIMLWWSLACMLHGLAGTFAWLLAMRFLLGMGEGGAFPAATRVVSEWLAPAERATAMGFINAGTAVGSLLAPPLIGLVIVHSGWRAVFFAAGAVGLLWVVVWGVFYRNPSSAPPINSGRGKDRMIKADETKEQETRNLLSFREIIQFRGVQALIFAKFMSDAAWYFLLFWLPKYLYDVRGFNIKQMSYYAWIPYAASGIGSFLGGWLSSRLLRRGLSLDLSRKLLLAANAAMMPAVILVPFVPVEFALLLFSTAFFAQQSWSGLIMTIPADVFPLSAVGTVAGLVGFGGSIGGAIFGMIAGVLLGRGFSYTVLFSLAGSFHIVGFIVLAVFGGRIQPYRSREICEIESHA